MKVEPKFKIGDVVMLRSGGPKMTINNLEESASNFYGRVHCRWFYGTEAKEEFFHQDALEIWKENDPK